MTAQPTGSLDPWCKDGSECKPEWDAEKMGHEHPLEFMAELLQQWPTGALTVDLEAEERHLRFIQIVAGYPEIGRGMYPLDWPTHPMSVKALQLSLFLDSLPVPEELIQNPSIKAHSVRSAILALDARKHEYGKKEELGKTQLGLLHKQCLTLLFRGIRFYESKFENDVKHKQASPTPQETLFLNNLHSSQKERLDKWWLKGKPYWASGIKLDPKDLDQVIIKEHIHELELKSIQDWIKRLSAREEVYYHLVDASRHNLLIGASVILECLFAKLRQHILAAYRPGSIIIDGGGRIEFYTKKNKVEEEAKKVIEQSLLLSTKPHPFQHIIEKTLINYGRGRKSQFSEKEWAMETNTPRHDAYLKFIGADKIIEFYPPVMFDDKYLHKKKEGHYNDPDCLICSPNIALKSTKPRQFTEPYDEICFLHALLFEIGQSQQRRDYSLRRSGNKIIGLSHNLGIHSCAMLDLNALGTMFGSPISKTPKLMTKILHFHQPPTPEYSEKVLPDDLKMQRIVQENLLQHNLRDSLKGSEEFENSNKFKQYVCATREQLTVVRTRKSFRFNSKWWSCVSQIIDTQSKYFAEIGAWVAAGDDLLLVRKGIIGEEDETLQEQLNELDDLLNKEFPNSRIKFSFCAGVAKRRKSDIEVSGNEKIPDMIERAVKRETLSKHNWKTRAKKFNRIELITSYDSRKGKLILKEYNKENEWKREDGPVYSISSVRKGVPTEEESMIYTSTYRGEEE